MPERTRSLQYIHRLLAEVEVDLSDQSDEYVIGFVDGIQAERDRMSRNADSTTREEG